MIKVCFPLRLIVISLCACGAFGLAALQPYEMFDELLGNEAEIIEAAEPLPGTTNLQEKRVPVRRLTIPAGYLGLYGIGNLGERSQLPANQYLLPGVRNLGEKSLPESLLMLGRAAVGELGSSARHPKSEVEKVGLL